MPESVRSIFISYSRRDAEPDPELHGRALIDELITHLAQLGDRARIWRDLKDLRAGEEWKPAIEEAIRSCEIFLYCASPESVASEFCERELAQARSQPRTTIIPICLRPVCRELLDVFRSQWLPQSVGSAQDSVAECKDRSARDRVWMAVVRGIAERLDDPPARPASPRAPLRPLYADVDVPRRDPLLSPARPRHRAAGTLLHLRLTERGDRVEVEATMPGRGAPLVAPWRCARARLEALAADARALDPHRWCELGDALGGLLLGEADAALWASLFPHLGASRGGPAAGAVRCRVVSEHAWVHEVPWRLARRQGRWLVADGWTFETADTDAAGPDHTLSCPRGGALLIVPDDPKIDGAAEHRHDLRATLAQHWRLDSDSAIADAVRVARDEEEARAIIKAWQPQVIYVLARLDEGGRLRLVGEEGHSAPRVADVAAWFDYVPAFCFWNLARPAAARLPPSLRELGRASLVAAAGAPLGWLMRDGGAVLAHLFEPEPGADPIAALHDVLLEQAARGTALAGALARGGYRTFSTHKHGRPTNPADPWVSLDRHDQRDAVLGRLREMRDLGASRALAVVGYGDARQAMPQLGRILSKHVSEVADVDFANLSYRLEVPDRLEGQDVPERFANALEGALRALLDLAPGEALGMGLKRAADRAGLPPQVLPLVWVRWRFPTPDGPEASRPASLSAGELDGWLRFSAETLHHACPLGVRVISVLGLTSDASRHAKIQATLDALLDTPSGERRARTHVLSALVNVTRDDVERYLRRTDSGCPPGWAAEVARALWDTASGEFEDTVQLLLQARDTGEWAALHRDGRALGAASAPPARRVIAGDEIL